RSAWPGPGSWRAKTRTGSPPPIIPEAVREEQPTSISDPPSSGAGRGVGWGSRREPEVAGPGAPRPSSPPAPPRSPPPPRSGPAPRGRGGGVGRPQEGPGRRGVEGPRAPERPHRLVGVAGVRLLAEDVLARLERPHRPVVMHAVGQADVDGVDLGVGQHRVVA